MTHQPIPISAVRYQPLVLGWIKIFPGLDLAIDSDHILDMSLYHNFYQLTVTLDRDPVVYSQLRYIGVVLITQP